MVNRTLLAALAMLCTAPLLAQPAAKVDLGANAALKYWQAFAPMMQRGEQDDKIIGDCTKTPLDDAARKIINKNATSLLYLQRGAKLAHCDWSLDREDGPALLLPHLNKCRQLARLGMLKARFEFQDGHAQAAVDDLADTIILARHGASEPMLVAVLVDYAIEHQVADVLAAHLPSMDAATLKHLEARLAALPSGKTSRDGVLWEKENMGQWLVTLLKTAEAKKKGSWREALGKPLSLDKESQDAKDALYTWSYEKVLQTAEGTASYYDEAARLMELPLDQIEPQWKPLIEKARKDNIFAALLLPGISKVADAEARYKARQAMLRAAIAVVRDGPEALKTIKDPYGDGPFEYQTMPGGFELKSKLVYKVKTKDVEKDELVTLRVGQSKKE
jgi:hypothetical protein